MQSIIKKSVSKFSTSIVIEYQDLKNNKNLDEVIQRAYGPKGLGILFVNNIPDYVEMRTKTLPLFSKLATLPKQILKKYERPDVFYSLGWSCGVEQFNGKYDTSKGSYYVNCVQDHPDPIKPENQKYYTENQKKILMASNIWVKQLPQIQKNVKQLAAKMIHVGTLLARQIDGLAAKHVKNYQKNHLQRVISTGHNHIGRMLHYFPFQQASSTEGDWCGWHNDHGSLTALTSAMYIDQQGNQTTQKVQSGGLFAKNRFAEVANIKIPKQMLAFQLGQSVQIKTGGFLQATPHCVVTSKELAGKKVGRSTFPLFMEPNHLQLMKIPDGIQLSKVIGNEAYKVPQLKDRWTNGMYFKDFHAKTIQYYT